MVRIRLFIQYLKMIFSHYLGFPLCGPDMVAVVVSNQCNLKCKMCGFWQFGGKSGKVLTLGDYDKLFRELKISGVKKVQFTGGEPLLRQDFLDILKSAKIYNLGTIVITNGTLINEENADALCKNSDKIFISLDAPERTMHDYLRGVCGTFDKVIAGVRLLNKAKIKNRTKTPRLIITSIITPHNIHEPEEMVALAENLGVDSIIYNPASSVKGYIELNDRFSDNRSSLSEYDAMVDCIIGLIGKAKIKIKSNPFYLDSSKHFLRNDKRFHEFTCYGGGYNGLHIVSNGDVHPCCAWDISMGNVTRQSFLNIWKSKEAKKIRKAIKFLKCPSCHHHTRTFDYIMRAGSLYKRDIHKLIRGYKQIFFSS